MVNRKILSDISLGGTSLINANVALEADELTWRQKKVWPTEIHKDYDSGKINEGISMNNQDQV